MQPMCLKVSMHDHNAAMVKAEEVSALIGLIFWLDLKLLGTPKENDTITGSSPNSFSSSACQETLSSPFR